MTGSDLRISIAGLAWTVSSWYPVYSIRSSGAEMLANLFAFYDFFLNCCSHMNSIQFNSNAFYLSKIADSAILQIRELINLLDS